MLGVLVLMMVSGCAQVGRENWVESVGGEMSCEVRMSRCVAQMERVSRGVEGIAPRMHVINSDIPAAYSWSGGDIYVTRSLVDALSDDQLAAVIAHEIGHLVVERVENRSEWVGLAGRSGTSTVLDVEMAADALGVKLLQKQGMEAGAMRDALEVLRTMPNCPGNSEQLRIRTAALAGAK